MAKRAQKEYYKYILFHGCQYEINKGIHRWIEQINKDRNYINYLSGCRNV